MTVLIEGKSTPFNSGLDLKLLDPDTGDVRAVLAKDVGFSKLAISPDNRFLVVRQHSNLAFDIYRIDKAPGLLMKVMVAGQDWIAWTPQGYYAATPGCEKMMGWASKRDDNHALVYYPAERFRKQLIGPTSSSCCSTRATSAAPWRRPTRRSARMPPSPSPRKIGPSRSPI